MAVQSFKGLIKPVNPEKAMNRAAKLMNKLESELSFAKKRAKDGQAAKRAQEADSKKK